MSFKPIRIGNTVIRRIKSASSSTESVFEFEIKNEASPFLIKSICTAATNANISKHDHAAASIEADDVLTMRDYLKRNRHATEMYVALRLVHDLGKQMQALISAGRSMACIGVDDVVVITHRDSDAFVHKSINDPDSMLGNSRMDPQFLVLNDTLMFELEDDGTLILDRALKPGFMSPELSESQLQSQPHPTQLHFKTIYHSVAQLVIYFLLGVDYTAEDLAPLNPIKGTKLYWFLLRCLNPVPAERKYIYV